MTTTTGPATAAPTETARWAAAHGLELHDDTEPIARRYLTRSRTLRRAGAVSAPVLAAAITASTGLDVHLSGIVWVLCGYLVGCIGAEVGLARLPVMGPTRRASLTARTRRSYCPRAMVAAQLVVPVTAAVLTLLAATLAPPVEPKLTLFAFGTDPSALRSSAVLAGVVAVAVMLAATVAQRLLIRRPQPLGGADRLALDDALRASAIHLVGATALAVADLLVASQLAYLSNLTTGAARAALVLGAVAATAAAWRMWTVWANRRWPTRRRVALASPTPNAAVR